MARDSGVSTSYIALLANGSRDNPSLKTLEQLATRGLGLNDKEKFDLYLSANRVVSDYRTEWLEEYLVSRSYRKKRVRELIERLPTGQLESVVNNGLIFTVWRGIQSKSIADYGKQLRKIRKEQLGLTQGQIMERTGIERAYLSHIERESKFPSLNMLKKLGYVYGVDRIGALLLKE